MLKIRSQGSSPILNDFVQGDRFALDSFARPSAGPIPNQNRDSFDIRLLSLVDQVMKGATEPTGLLTMGLAGAAFRFGRFGMMARLTASPAKSFFTYGIGARIASGLFGFSLELPTLTATSHLAGKVLGHDSASWSHDLTSNLLVMGSLRLAGGLGTVLSRVIGTSSNWAPQLIAQTSMLGGTWLGLRAEHWAGLRKFSPDTNLLQESLQILLQNQIAGHLSRPLFGAKFAAWEQGMEQKTEYLAQQAQSKIPFVQNPLFHSVYAMAAGPSEFSLPIEGLESSVEPTGRNGRVENGVIKKSIVEFNYPPEVEAAWRHLEERWSQKDYYEGNRETLARRRPDLEAMDQIWLHQAEDYGRKIPGGRVEILDAEALLERSPEESFNTDPLALQQALHALGKRNRVGDLARRLVRIHVPKSFYNSDHESSDLSYLSQLPFLVEAEQNLALRVRFVTHGEQFMVFNISSLSLLEKLGQTVLGKNSVQLHPVPGTIPQDTVMSLRAKRVSPVGFSRGRIFFGDANMEVHPFSFSAHDALIHALVDANIFDPYPEIAGWLYQRIQQRLPDGELKEGLLSQLSDSNLGKGKTRIKHFAQQILAVPLQAALHSAQLSENLQNNLGKLKYLDRLASAYHDLVLEEFRTQDKLAGKEKFFLAPLNHTLRGVKILQKITEESLALGLSVPPTVYNGKILSAVHRIEKKFQDPNYLQGTQEELLAKRVSLRDADALWFHQAKHYANLFPGARYYTTGAEILIQKGEGKFVEPDLTLLKHALSLLGKRERANSPARQVLIIEIPENEIGIEFLPKFPQLQFLSTYPLASDFEQSLGDRIHLMDYQNGKIIYRIPSLSLAEKLLQVAHGPDRVQFHFVPGILPRDMVMEFKGKRVAPIALTFGPVYFGEIDQPVHPFILTDHDAFEHAAKDAQQPRAIREMGSILYQEIKEAFPDSPSKEKVLNDLADLSFSPLEGSPAAALAKVMLRPLDENIRAMKHNYDVQEIHELFQESRSFAEAYSSLLQERFSSNPALVEHSSTFLRPFEEILQKLSVESLTPEGPELSYLSTPITYPPKIERIWLGIENILRRPDSLQGSREELLAKRPPEDWVDQLWLFQGEDYFRRFPKDQIRVRIGDIEEMYLSGDPKLSSGIDWLFLQRALGLLGDRNQYGSPARQVLEIEMSNELLNATFMGSIIGSEKSFSILGIFLDVDPIPANKIPLKLFKEKTTLFRIPALSLWENILKLLWGHQSTQFHYVLGTLPGESSNGFKQRNLRRDIAMSLRGQRTPPVGLFRDPIYLEDVRGMVHPFILAFHDGFFHNPRDAANAAGIPELSHRIYRYMGKRFSNDPEADQTLTQLADLDDLRFLIQEIIPFLTLADQRKLNLTDPMARRQEIVELDALSAALHPIVRKKWLGQEEELSPQEQALLQDFLRLREGIQLERKKFFPGS